MFVTPYFSCPPALVLWNNVGENSREDRYGALCGRSIESPDAKILRKKVGFLARIEVSSAPSTVTLVAYSYST